MAFFSRRNFGRGVVCNFRTTVIRFCGRRSLSAFLLAFIIVATVFMVYLGVEVLQLPTDNKGRYVEKTESVRGTVLWKNILLHSASSMETVASVSHERDGNFKDVKELMMPGILVNHEGQVLDEDITARSWSNYTFHNHSRASSDNCDVSFVNSTAGIHMLDVYERTGFENVDGGTWKQGFPLQYNDSQWNARNKLLVYVVPHSHNDPGWIKTFEKYYLDQTKHILNNMLKKLSEDRRRKFIWAEISFFSLWWRMINPMQRRVVRQLIDQGQLEIVTGGWVMNDEAVTHYFAMTEQLIEGHEWLWNHIGYLPTNGWAIDPFGLSPTMAYLLKRMGFSHMVVQRVHYVVKKYLAKQKNLEFSWRQMWDYDNSTDILCHVMPFYSYDIPHTCGPDPKVCCQFDFKRLPGGKTSCPWKVPPQPITLKNVEERAMMLLDQYRKKSQLFRTNVLLVPLGDDFRYDKIIEWDQQFSNYQRLFDYMNSRHGWNVHAQFGTLNDYFAAVANAVLENGGRPNFESLSGDFFSYADRDDHYWSGFYSSRPFYKSMDRSLEAYLRASEIAFSMLLMSFRSADHVFSVNHSLALLVDARRNLGLFQHHDAITGTARDPVVVDYGTRLLHSVRELHTVLSQATSLLIGSYQFPHVKFDLDDNRSSHSSISKKTVIDVPPEGQTVVFYNSLGRTRDELVSLLVSTRHVCVTDPTGTIVSAQLNPVWKKTEIDDRTYEIVFAVAVRALGFAAYKLNIGSSENCLAFPAVYVRQSVDFTEYGGLPWNVSRLPAKTFSLTNSYVKATFTESGFLRSIANTKDNFTTDVTVSFLVYGTRKQKDKSGAYLFLPGGNASPIPIQNHYFHVISGSLQSEVLVVLPHVQHRVLLKSSNDTDGFGVDVENIVDIGKEKNREIVMRIETSVRSGTDFYTDQNGFQMVRRRTFNNLPLQANFYPVSSMLFVQDESVRFTAVVRQSHGAASLRPGWLEFVLDRRLMQDDNRGLQQGVLDNVPTPSHFRLLVERCFAEPTASAKVATSPSLTAHLASHSLLYPLVNLVAVPDGSADWQLQPSFSILERELPCDLHVVNLRTMISETESSVVAARNASLLLLHRLGFDCHCNNSYRQCQLSNGKFNFGHFFTTYVKNEVVQTSLSGLYNLKRFSKTTTVQLQPMEIYAFKIWH